MTGPVRVVGFLGVLAVVFAVALGIGTTLGPVSRTVTGPAAGPMADHAEEEGGHADAGHAPAADEEMPGGLMVSEAGYTLRLSRDQAGPGRDVPVRFRIDGPDGRPVTAYDVQHGKRLHLIAVRRDLSGFQHVHPELDKSGDWSTALDLTPGGWRLFADFNPTGGVGLVLGADLSVRGDYRPQGPPGQVRTVRVDGYEVTLDGDLTPGADATLTLSVSRDGRPVTDLQPYLGAYGHLVALREGDLAYLHVHPDGAPGDGSTRPGPEVVFEAAVPSVGDYRLFLDFRHDGAVRTAELALTAGDSQRGADAEGAGEEQDHDHGH